MTSEEYQIALKYSKKLIKKGDILDEYDIVHQAFEKGFTDLKSFLKKCIVVSNRLRIGNPSIRSVEKFRYCKEHKEELPIAMFTPVKSKRGEGIEIYTRNYCDECWRNRFNALKRKLYAKNPLKYSCKKYRDKKKDSLEYKIKNRESVKKWQTLKKDDPEYKKKRSKYVLNYYYKNRHTEKFKKKKAQLQREYRKRKKRPRVQDALTLKNP